MLLNTQGRDMTALFEAFHPFTDRPHNLLAKMKEVGAQCASRVVVCVVGAQEPSRLANAH